MTCYRLQNIDENVSFSLFTWRQHILASYTFNTKNKLFVRKGSIKLLTLVIFECEGQYSVRSIIIFISWLRLSQIWIWIWPLPFIRLWFWDFEDSFLTSLFFSFLAWKNRNSNAYIIELTIKELTVRFLHLMPGPQGALANGSHCHCYSCHHCLSDRTRGTDRADHYWMT